MSHHRHTIRNLDRDLILEARIYALQSGQTLGELINFILDEFLTDLEENDEGFVEQAA